MPPHTLTVTPNQLTCLQQVMLAHFVQATKPKVGIRPGIDPEQAQHLVLLRSIVDLLEITDRAVNQALKQK